MYDVVHTRKNKSQKLYATMLSRMWIMLLKTTFVFLRYYVSKSVVSEIYAVKKRLNYY